MHCFVNLDPRDRGYCFVALQQNWGVGQYDVYKLVPKEDFLLCNSHSGAASVTIEVSLLTQCCTG